MLLRILRLLYLTASSLALGGAMTNRKVPPRWLDCPRKGKLLAGKFLPFKTPLSGRFVDMREGCQFSPEMLLEAVAGRGLTMGLVVDLTKTDRFYDKADLVSKGIGHYKLKCEGFGSTPTAEQTAEFCQVCAHFFRQHPDQIIGVHCTHGYNRTGFLTIAYLVDQDDWSLEAAISSFSKCRPPGIYKGHYLEELAHRYHGNISDICVPELPEWCLLEGEEGADDGDRRVAVGGEDKQDSGQRKRRREQQKENATFAVSVCGVSVVVGPIREEVQHRCQDILNWEGSGFPGSQPVSMDRKNLQFLKMKPYRVSWKADGTRYIMYIRGKGEVFLLDRDNSVFVCAALVFPARTPGEHLLDTLLDGELVEDRLPNGVRPRYLAYDIMQLCGRADIARCDHATRLQCIQREIIYPRDMAAQHGSLDKLKEPFSVRLKQFWDVKDTRWVLERFVPKITHENDGLIFNPLEDAYEAGQCSAMLKWKPPNLNTVDFRLAIVEDDREGMLKEKMGQLWVGGYHLPFSHLDLKRNKEARIHNGHIVECSWSTHGWTFLRVREDKSFPNSYTTAVSVCASIKEPVTRDILLRVVETERWSHPHHPTQATPHQDSQDLMPPPRKHPRTDSLS